MRDLMLHMHTCSAGENVFWLSRHDWKNRFETVLRFVSVRVVCTPKSYLVMVLHVQVPGGQTLEYHRTNVTNILPLSSMVGFLRPPVVLLMGSSRPAQKLQQCIHATCNQAESRCSHSDSHLDSSQAAVGAGVEDVREVRQRLVAIEAGIVKSQRQEDKRGVDLLHRLSESEVSAATWLNF